VISLIFSNRNVRSALAGLAVLFVFQPVLAGSTEITYLGAIRNGLSAPVSLDASQDQIAVLQTYSRQILLYTSDGAITRRINISGDSRGLARLSATTYLFCDRTLGLVRAIDINSGRQWTFLGSLGTPECILVDEGTCFILDSQSGRIISADSQGQQLGELVLSPQPGSMLEAPSSFAFDRTRNVFHVFEQHNSQAHIFDKDGNYFGAYCSFGNETGTITRGGGMVCDADGYVYILDRYQGRISVFDPDQNFVADISTSVFINEPLVVPSGIAVDPSGTVYVSSTETNSIHMFFLDKSSLPLGDLAALPLYPGPAGVQEAGNVSLVAKLVAYSENSSYLAADFRVLTAESPEIVITEVIGVEVDEPGRDEQGRLVGTATWQPGEALQPGTKYQWQARARTEERIGSWSELVSFSTLPRSVRYNLEANYPNPFNPWTTISFTVPEVRQAQLIIFNLSGLRIWSKTMQPLSAGRHTITWTGHDSDGNTVASGVYFYRLQTKDFIQTRKMVLIR
jgi:DNA-binding beta-propeller fold protein YncE